MVEEGINPPLFSSKHRLDEGDSCGIIKLIYNCKIAEETWPPKARIPSLNPPIPCPLSSITFSIGKQKRATY